MNEIINYFRKNIITAYWYGWDDIAKVFFTSMIPVLELRAAIAFGPAHNMPWFITYIAAVVGNLIPIPFIILFIKKIIDFMLKRKAFERVARWVEEKAQKNRGKVERYEKWGLFLFVAIPLPGTGAWTGALVAALAGMRLRNAFPTIAAGVATAGIIMTFFYYFLAKVFPDISYTLVVGCIAAVVVISVTAVYLTKKALKKSKNSMQQ